LPLWNLDLHIPNHAWWANGTGTPAAASVVAESGDALAACHTASLDAQAAVPFELALQAETLLALFAELAFGALGG
jgi:hypothetical protein